MNKSIIKKIILEQKQEIEYILSKSFVKREEEDILKKSLEDDLIKVVAGVRRSGKSSLVHRALMGKKYGYLNFDDERLQNMNVQELNLILEGFYEIESDLKILFFDEIQNVEGWELFVSRLRRQGYIIIVTGSNSKLLGRELATHLTGRHFSMELYPFSFREYLGFRKIKFEKNELLLTKKRADIYRELNEYLKNGGFPESLSVNQPRIYLRELYTKIILQDIVGRYNIRHSSTLKNIAQYLIGNFATRQTYHKLKNIFEIKSVHTIKNYLGYLEEVYLIFQLTAFSAKQKESLRGPKKIYSIDQGLVQAINPGISENIGRLMENVVFIELKRREKDIFYYNDYAGWEVDFLIKEGVKIKELIQVTNNLHSPELKKREIRSLLKGSDKFRCDVLKIIIYDGDKKKITTKGKTIEIIPLVDWILELRS